MPVGLPQRGGLIAAAFYGGGVHGTADAPASREADACPMKLADRSPGLVIVLAGVVVYGTILIEIGMWMVASWLAMFTTLALAIVLALAIAWWFDGLVSDGAPASDEAMPAPVPAALPAQPVKARAPRFGAAQPV